LYELLKDEKSFFFFLDQQASFEQLKRALQCAPVLIFPDFSKEFILTTDASGYAIGAILTQLANDNKEHLISCHSRTLKDAEKRYSNFDREILAVFYGVQQNRSYLWGSKCIIRSDNIAIPYLDRSKTSDSSRAIRWFIKLSEYDYKVEHRKGTKIAHADALSRYPADQAGKGRAKIMVPVNFYIILSAILFTIGALGVLLRRNPLIIFMSIELMLNSANLAMVAFSSAIKSFSGQIFVFFVIAVLTVWFQWLCHVFVIFVGLTKKDLMVVATTH